jgi:hypothetical protein
VAQDGPKRSGKIPNRLITKQNRVGKIQMPLLGNLQLALTGGSASRNKDTLCRQGWGRCDASGVQEVGGY